MARTIDNPFVPSTTTAESDAQPSPYKAGFDPFTPSTSTREVGKLPLKVATEASVTPNVVENEADKMRTDMKAFLTNLLAEMSDHDIKRTYIENLLVGLDTVGEVSKAPKNSIAVARPKRKLDPEYVWAEVRRILDEDTNFVPNQGDGMVN